MLSARIGLLSCTVLAYCSQSLAQVEREQQQPTPTAQSVAPQASPPEDEDTRPHEPATVEAPSEPPPRPREICAAEAETNAMLDRLRTKLYTLTCSSASWFDGLFGNERFDEDYRSSYGSLTTGVLWSERQSFKEVVRFRARLYLPQANRRLHAFVGRVDRDDYVSESESDVYGLPREFERDNRETTLVGIGFNEPLKKRGSFDVSSGVRVRFPLDPYVKGSYRFARPIGERNLFRLRETAFWQHSEQFGVTSRMDWDRALGERHLMRYTASGTFSEMSEGVRWFSSATLYHFLSDNRALAYEIGANGSTDREVPLTDYGLSLIYRQRIWRDWLLMEARTGVDWPRDYVYEQRKLNWNAGIAFELRFGNDPAHVDSDAQPQLNDPKR